MGLGNGDECCCENGFPAAFEVSVILVVKLKKGEKASLYVPDVGII